MRSEHPTTSGGFTGIVRDPMGGIDMRFYERRARIERDHAIDSLAKWIVGSFTAPRRPMREG
jgi:hypothetical protein